MLALRLILVLVIAASAGVIVLGEIKLKPKLDQLEEDKKKVTDDLGTEKSKSTKLTTDLRTANDKKDALENDLNVSKTAEASAKAAAEVSAKAKQAADNATNLAKVETAKTKQEAADYFALQTLGLTPTVIRRINDDLPKATNEINTLKTEQRVTMVQLTKKSGELNAFLNPKGAVALPDGLNGKVSAVDPKWDFVILDIGANHGLLQNGELTIHREGKLIARVKLAKVDTDYAIANVMAGFKKSEIREGDTVLTPTSMVLPPQR